MEERPCLYGIVAEFGSEEELLAAVRATRAAGYRELRAYTPYPVEELPEALGMGPSRLPWLVAGAIVAAATAAFALQYYSAVHAYPLDVAGRPPFSWPAFIPVTLEVALLVGAISALGAMILLNRLPQLYHPIFNLPDFELASQGRFFLCIRASDRRFQRRGATEFLQRQGARAVREAPC